MDDAAVYPLLTGQRKNLLWTPGDEINVRKSVRKNGHYEMGELGGGTNRYIDIPERLDMTSFVNDQFY